MSKSNENFKVGDSVDVVVRARGEIKGYGSLTVPGIIVAMLGKDYFVKYAEMTGKDTKINRFPLNRLEKPANPKKKYRF